MIDVIGHHESDGVQSEVTKPDGLGRAFIGISQGLRAAGLFWNQNTGPGPGQVGARGISDGFSEEAAGIMAEGNGVAGPGAPRAAALRIQNGAVTVGGENRPAGTLDLSGVAWTDQQSCETFCAKTCFHKHQVSRYAEKTLPNTLIKGDSIILLTVRTTGVGGDPRTYYAQVSAQTSGSATVRVTAVGNDPACLDPDPGEEVKVHYWIINPLPP